MSSFVRSILHKKKTLVKVNGLMQVLGRDEYTLPKYKNGEINVVIPKEYPKNNFYYPQTNNITKILIPKYDSMKTIYVSDKNFDVNKKIYSQSYITIEKSNKFMVAVIDSFKIYSKNLYMMVKIFVPNKYQDKEIINKIKTLYITDGNNGYDFNNSINKSDSYIFVHGDNNCDSGDSGEGNNGITSIKLVAQKGFYMEIDLGFNEMEENIENIKGLPSGFYLEDNVIKGTPINAGEFDFTIFTDKEKVIKANISISNLIRLL